jgi:hypothetical protein
MATCPCGGSRATAHVSGSPFAIAMRESRSGPDKALAALGISPAGLATMGLILNDTRDGSQSVETTDL